MSRDNVVVLEGCGVVAAFDTVLCVDDDEDNTDFTVLGMTLFAARITSSDIVTSLV